RERRRRDRRRREGWRHGRELNTSPPQAPERRPRRRSASTSIDRSSPDRGADERALSYTAAASACGAIPKAARAAESACDGSRGFTPVLQAFGGASRKLRELPKTISTRCATLYLPPQTLSVACARSQLPSQALSAAV